MAIYHLSGQIIGRAGGRSAVAAAAYRAAEKIGAYDYRRKEKPLSSGILAPEKSPDFCLDRGALWSAVEAKENRKNSQFAREFNLAIPAEIADKADELVREFCQKNFVSRGLVVDYAIHSPNRKGDQRNIHAHIMHTTRAVHPDGWGDKDREIMGRESLFSIRKSWEEIANSALEKSGEKIRIDCRTLEAQGVDRLPQQHQGVHARNMERRGIAPRRDIYHPEKLAENLRAKPAEERRKIAEKILPDLQKKAVRTAMAAAVREVDSQRMTDAECLDKVERLRSDPHGREVYQALRRRAEKLVETLGETAIFRAFRNACAPVIRREKTPSVLEKFLAEKGLSGEQKKPENLAEKIIRQRRKNPDKGLDL